MHSTIQIEITRLVQMLTKADIPFDIAIWTVHDYPCIEIVSPNAKEGVVDAVCNQFSYGGSKGFLEVMGSANPNLPNDDVVGWLTAEQAFEYFKS